MPDSFDFARDGFSLEFAHFSRNINDETWILYKDIFQLIKMNLTKLRVKTVSSRIKYCW